MTDHGNDSVEPSLSSDLLQKPQQPLDGNLATQLGPHHDATNDLKDAESKTVQPCIHVEERTGLVDTNPLEVTQPIVDDYVVVQDEAQDRAEQADVANGEMQENALDVTIDTSTLQGNESGTPNAIAVDGHTDTDSSDVIAAGLERPGEMPEPSVGSQGKQADKGSGSPYNDNKDDAEEELFDELDYNTDEEGEASKEGNLVANDFHIGANGIATKERNNQADHDSHDHTADRLKVDSSHSLPDTEEDYRDRFELHPEDTSHVESLDARDNQYFENNDEYERQFYPAEVIKLNPAGYGHSEALPGRDLVEHDIEQQPGSSITKELLTMPLPSIPRTIHSSSQNAQQEPTTGHRYESTQAGSPGPHKRPRSSEEESEGVGAELQGTSSLTLAHIIVCSKHANPVISEAKRVRST